MNIEHLQAQLKRVRMGGILETLESRLVQARESNLSHTELLGLILQDELQRREVMSLSKRIKQAKFEEKKTLEELRFDRYPVKVQQIIRDLANGSYLESNQHILIVGPTGTGKTHLAQAFGHQACRQGYSVHFIHANLLLRKLHGSRADNSWEKLFRKLLSFDLLIIDDFGLKNLTHTQADDIYELIAELYLKKSIIVTSNRKVEGWVELFPDPVMANAALDRLSNLSHHIVLEGQSYRRERRPTTTAINE
jgi:DNA replication protein DnaC